MSSATVLAFYCATLFQMGLYGFPNVWVEAVHSGEHVDHALILHWISNIGWIGLFVTGFPRLRVTTPPKRTRRQIQRQEEETTVIIKVPYVKGASEKLLNKA